ncbi:MAG: PAS domain S-box protein [Hyphomicrobium sp.]|uniref:PAS domain-containing protein n=1 Tax=Hyphomicrobium sp. TaxID=82 RepID=UPI0039E6AC1C
MIAGTLRILLETVPDGFFVHDIEGRILDVNERSCLDLGYSRDELLAMTINDISCGQTPDENAAAWANAPPGMAATFRQTAMRKDGSIFSVEISVTCQMIDGRKLFLGLARDISERETARAAIETLNKELELRVEQRTAELKEARELLQAVMDSAHDVILFQDRNGRYKVLNESAEQLVGIPRSEALGKTAIETFGIETGGRIRQEECKVLASGQAWTSEEHIPIAGENRTFLTTRSVHRDRQGAIAGLVTVARDITDLRRSEHQIRQEHDRMMHAARVAGLGIWDYDLVRDVLHCDDQWYQIMGRDPDHPIHSVAEFKPFIHPDDVERATEVDAPAARLSANRQDYGIVFRIIRPDGEVRWVRSAASIITDLYGVPARAVGFIIDITEALLTEEHLEQMQKSLQEERGLLENLSRELQTLGKELQN